MDNEHDYTNLFGYIVWHGDDYGFKPRPASKPTTARPGTKDKVAVLAARVVAGEELWHPADVVIQHEPRVTVSMRWRHCVSRHTTITRKGLP